MRNLVKNFLTLFLIFLILASFFSLFVQNQTEIKEISISELVQRINENKVKKIEVEGTKLNILLIDETKETSLKEPNETISNLLKNYGLEPQKIQNLNIAITEPSGLDFWLANLLPFLIPFLIIGVFIFLMSRQFQKANIKAMMFGESKAKEVNPKEQKITFKDVADLKEAKEELKEIVEFLRNPKKFTNLGAKIPKGVLLMGPAGCGKTLLARAVAGESKVPFFHISGSEFIELFVGVGSARVRSLFQKAKKSLPSIIFIDELDAIGKQRGTGLTGSHEEREQTLNQILVEMDGFEPNIGLVILAATNRPDVLDFALLRPGRFDRRIFLDAPDKKGREAILKIHTKNKPLDSSVNLKRIAERTPGFSGADLANLANEAAILTARKNKKEISQLEIEESVEKVLLGPERKSHLLSEKEKEITAYHEAGHALVAHELPQCDPVQKISIISRGRAAGYTLKLPIEDRYLYPKSKFLDELAAFLAGYAAEKEIFHEVTTGATNDLKQATNLAKKLVMEYGMSSLGPRTFGVNEEISLFNKEFGSGKDYSEKIAQLIDNEVFKFINEAYKKALEIINNKRTFLEKIAKLLLEKENIEKKEFNLLFKSN
ncbi:MAG: cell division protease FtsH [Parcubacteria group bacterium Athens1014_10]|nr:MAG: cell division protease FtsH [Parcubacteria group bacterium Athens1014_10]TSD05109.1 MAG: cell division protease FtsH [Parcubacteria group bacterium Athens0714_12]